MKSAAAFLLLSLSTVSAFAPSHRGSSAFVGRHNVVDTKTSQGVCFLNETMGRNKVLWDGLKHPLVRCTTPLLFSRCEWPGIREIFSMVFLPSSVFSHITCLSLSRKLGTAQSKPGPDRTSRSVLRSYA